MVLITTNNDVKHIKYFNVIYGKSTNNQNIDIKL